MDDEHYDCDGNVDESVALQSLWSFGLSSVSDDDEPVPLAEVSQDDHILWSPMKMTSQLRRGHHSGTSPTVTAYKEDSPVSPFTTCAQVSSFHVLKVGRYI